MRWHLREISLFSHAWEAFEILTCGYNSSPPHFPYIGSFPKTPLSFSNFTVSHKMYRPKHDIILQLFFTVQRTVGTTLNSSIEHTAINDAQDSISFSWHSHHKMTHSLLRINEEYPTLKMRSCQIVTPLSLVCLSCFLFFF